MLLNIRYPLIFLLVYLTQIVFSQELRINEVVSSNISGIKDKSGDYSDWIEIHNLTSSTIDLGGYYLSDKKENPLKWKFPTFLIAANGYILVFASEKNSTETELHANFKLATEGENILLSKPDGNLIAQLDSIPLKDDISYGFKIEENSSYKYFSEPTPKAANTTNAFLGFLGETVLNFASGFYPVPIDVRISQIDVGAEARYTLNCD